MILMMMMMPLNLLYSTPTTQETSFYILWAIWSTLSLGLSIHFQVMLLTVQYFVSFLLEKGLSKKQGGGGGVERKGVGHRLSQDLHARIIRPERVCVRERGPMRIKASRDLPLFFFFSGLSQRERKREFIKSESSSSSLPFEPL